VVIVTVVVAVVIVTVPHSCAKPLSGRRRRWREGRGGIPHRKSNFRRERRRRKRRES
jgi:hypothetical protein